MRVIVIPDSFKGSLEAPHAAGIIADALRSRGIRARAIPVADGGEGTVECLRLAAGGEVLEDQVVGPLRDEVTACRGVLPDGTAVVELAQAAGLTLVGKDLRAGDATTYGVGQQILAAVADGASEVIVGIGGSATNDGGCGAAAACGIRFLDADGKAFVPTGRTLTRIAVIDADGLDDRVAEADIVAMCDVDNPLTGPHGAAAIFGPQKGADEAMVERLDAGLVHLAELIERDLDVDVEELPGAGAAGGMGAGLVAFFGARLRKGIDVVLDAVEFDRLLGEADAIVTGEGSFDAQSMRGKVINGIAHRAQREQVPVHVLAGLVADDVEVEAESLGIASVRSINPEGIDVDDAIAHAAEHLRAAAEALADELLA